MVKLSTYYFYVMNSFILHIFVRKVNWFLINAILLNHKTCTVNIKLINFTLRGLSYLIYFVLEFMFLINLNFQVELK